MNYSLLEKKVNDSKLNKNKIAKLSGISRTTLDSAINGADVKISTLEKIAKGVGFSVAVLFDDIPQAESVTITNGSAAAVNVNAPINAPITAKSENAETHLLALLAEKDKVLEEKEKMIQEKERLIQILLKSQGQQ